MGTRKAALAAIAGLMILGAVPAIGGSSASLPATLAVARQEAAWAGDPGVPVAQAVLTNRHQADLESGAIIFDDRPVYLVQIQGHFTLLDASVPPGVKAPQGSWLTFTVATSGGMVYDLGVSDRPLDLAALGPVITLEL